MLTLYVKIILHIQYYWQRSFCRKAGSHFNYLFSVSETKFVNIKHYMNDNISSATEQNIPNIVLKKKLPESSYLDCFFFQVKPGL